MPNDATCLSESLPDGSNPFERQNTLFAQITGIDAPLFMRLESTEIAPVHGGDTSVLNVPAGTHEIEMTYRSPGIMTDAGITGCTIAGPLLAHIPRAKRRPESVQTSN